MVTTPGRHDNIVTIVATHVAASANDTHPRFHLPVIRSLQAFVRRILSSFGRPEARIDERPTYLFTTADGYT
jgi:hypothetical protein